MGRGKQHLAVNVPQIHIHGFWKSIVAAVSVEQLDLVGFLVNREPVGAFVWVRNPKRVVSIKAHEPGGLGKAFQRGFGQKAVCSIRHNRLHTLKRPCITGTIRRRPNAPDPDIGDDRMILPLVVQMPTAVDVADPELFLDFFNGPNRPRYRRHPLHFTAQHVLHVQPLRGAPVDDAGRPIVQGRKARLVTDDARRGPRHRPRQTNQINPTFRRYPQVPLVIQRNGHDRIVAQARGFVVARFDRFEVRGFDEPPARGADPPAIGRGLDQAPRAVCLQILRKFRVGFRPNHFILPRRPHDAIVVREECDFATWVRQGRFHQHAFRDFPPRHNAIRPPPQRIAGLPTHSIVAPGKAAADFTGIQQFECAGSGQEAHKIRGVQKVLFLRSL